METWDTIRARRNVRQYQDRPLSDDALNRILEAGRRAPSSMNWQPWDFVVVTDRQNLTALSQVWIHVATSPGPRPRLRSWRPFPKTISSGTGVPMTSGRRP